MGGRDAGDTGRGVVETAGGRAVGVALPATSTSSDSAPSERPAGRPLAHGIGGVCRLLIGDCPRCAAATWVCPAFETLASTRLWAATVLSTSTGPPPRPTARRSPPRLRPACPSAHRPPRQLSGAGATPSEEEPHAVATSDRPGADGAAPTAPLDCAVPLLAATCLDVQQLPPMTLFGVVRRRTGRVFRHPDLPWAPAETWAFCPQCLEPPGRWPLWWYHSWAVMCPKHNCYTVSYCPDCGSPFSPSFLRVTPQEDALGSWAATTMSPSRRLASAVPSANAVAGPCGRSIRCPSPTPLCARFINVWSVSPGRRQLQRGSNSGTTACGR